MAKAKSNGKRPKTGSKLQAAAAGQTIAVEPTEPKKKIDPVEFFKQVDAERKKIVWPSRKETWITSVMVFIMVLIAAIFFWVVDTGLSFAFRWIIGLGS